MPLPEPATAAALGAAEAQLGVVLPPLLRRLYLEVANGGFGPGSGIIGVRGGWTTDHGRSIEDLYEEMADSTTEDPRWVWPAGLVPLIDYGGTFACVDATTADGRIVDWDPDELDGRGPDGGWSRSFHEVAPSLAAWLERWLDAPAPADETAALMAQAMSTIPEVTRQYWASMTPEQRAAYGLPATGWGRALFGKACGDDPRIRARYPYGWHSDSLPSGGLSASSDRRVGSPVMTTAATTSPSLATASPPTGRKARTGRVEKSDVLSRDARYRTPHSHMP